MFWTICYISSVDLCPIHSQAMVEFVIFKQKFADDFNIDLCLEYKSCLISLTIKEIHGFSGLYFNKDWFLINETR